MENNDYNSFTYSDEDEEIRLSSLIKKMMSHTKLMLFTVIIFVILSFVYGYVLYEPAYDASAWRYRGKGSCPWIWKNRSKRWHEFKAFHKRFSEDHLLDEP